MKKLFSEVRAELRVTETNSSERLLLPLSPKEQREEIAFLSGVQGERRSLRGATVLGGLSHRQEMQLPSPTPLPTTGG